MNYFPKIEYGPGPTTILFEFPPSDDYLNTEVDASETTSRSFNGRVQTSWGYNQVTINPKFNFISQKLMDEVNLFFNAWASRGEMFKYYPASDSPEFYVAISKDKKIVPRIERPGSNNPITGKMDFDWAFNLPMFIVDPGTYAVAGSPVTSVNTRIGNVFIREIYNASETDLVAVSTDTGLNVRIINSLDINGLTREPGRLGFITNLNKFVGFDGTTWNILDNGPILNNQTLADGEQVVLLPVPYQIVKITAAAPITLALLPFKDFEFLPDRAIIEIWGSSDTNTISINFNDTDDGIISFGNTKLFNWYLKVFQWHLLERRFVEMGKNF